MVELKKNEKNDYIIENYGNEKVIENDDYSFSGVHYSFISIRTGRTRTGSEKFRLIFILKNNCDLIEMIDDVDISISQALKRLRMKSELIDELIDCDEISVFKLYELMKKDEKKYDEYLNKKFKK